MTSHQHKICTCPVEKGMIDYRDEIQRHLCEKCPKSCKLCNGRTDVNCTSCKETGEYDGAMGVGLEEVGVMRGVVHGACKLTCKRSKLFFWVFFVGKIVVFIKL